MKRSDSMAGLISMCPNSTEEENPMYSREFQTMLEGFDEEGCCVEESGQKKRRLGVDQVKALEKNFEVDNKLEPDRKVKLAQELGLQPRQVAVWFQNRRARWKTKQLERDYGVLKGEYDGLKHNFDKLQADNESLLKQIRDLKSKLCEDDKSEEEAELEIPIEEEANVEMLEGACVFGDLKDGSSDSSDSSAILNDDNTNTTSPTAAAAISSVNQEIPHHKLMNGSSLSSSSSSSTNFQLSDANRVSVYQPQFVKIEEHNFFGEESCTTFFSDDQAPTLHWYCSDQW